MAKNLDRFLILNFDCLIQANQDNYICVLKLTEKDNKNNPNDFHEIQKNYPHI